MAKTAKKPAAAEPQAPHLYHDSDAGAWYFVLGTLRCPIDGRDLSLTIGAAQHGYGNGLVDRWSDNVWKEILTWMGLPCDPLIRDLAQWPLKRLVQRLWMEQFDARTMELAAEKILARDNETKKAYLASFETAKSGAVEKRDRAVANLGGHGFAKKEYTYVPTDSLKKIKIALKGQQSLVFDFFKKQKWAGATCAEVTAALVAGGFKCNQDPERAIYYYLNEWRKKSWLSAE